MMVFNAALAKNSPSQLRIMEQQYAQVNAHRDDPRHALPTSIFANAGTRPADLYREFDSQTVAQFRLDEGDNILNDIMPMSRSIPIGRTVLSNARASDAGTFQQSMSGEQGSVFDNIDYDIDSYIIPVNQNGFKRSWREGEQLSLEAFDDATNQQREAVRTHRQGIIDSFLDGHKDNDGRLIVVDNVSWAGCRTDSRVDQVDLGSGGFNIDFTSGAVTGEAFRAAWIRLAERRYITNKVTIGATYYVSNEIYFNMARQYSNEYSAGSIMQNLMTVPGVMAIKPSSRLSGNQVLSIPLDSRYLQPITGMGVSTIACPRPSWNDPFAFEVVSAIGWQVKTDFGTTNKALQYASS